jgi:hypothetical protein
MTERGEEVTPEEGNSPRPRSVHADTPNPIALDSPSLDPVDPQAATRAAELARLRAWQKRKQEEQELEMLRQLQARSNAGEKVPFYTADPSLIIGEKPIASGSSRNVKLPPPKAPHVFKGSDRRNYDMWVEDCEEYIENSDKLLSEDARVRFGLRYVLDPIRQDWNGLVADRKRKDPSWSPTWEILKAEMLLKLGPEYQREQKAFNDARNLRQYPGQTPAEVLNKLRTLWADAGIHDEQIQIKWLTGSLSKELQDELTRHYQEPASDLQDAENRATRHYQVLHGANSLPNTANKHPPTPNKRRKSQNAEHTSASSAEDDRKAGTPSDRKKRSRKRGKGGKPPFKGKDKDKEDPKQDGKKRSTESRPLSEITCHKCGKKGHYANQCTEPPSSGKDKGRRT